MIDIYSQNVTVASQSAIPFNNVILHKGCATTLTGANTIELNRCGVYNIEITADAIASTAGAITLQIYKNGLPYAIPVTETAADTTSSHALALSALVQVAENNSKCNCCAAPTTISIMNLGTDAIYNINVAATRL